MQIKFDEAANTLSVFNVGQKTYGPAVAPGTEGRLTAGGVTLHTGSSSVVAAGPTAKTVTLNLDLSLSRLIHGRHFTIEAAASNDAGLVDPFKFAGVLDVT
jgi:hypothetical protein